jgi:small GTP-binding protein
MHEKLEKNYIATIGVDVTSAKVNIAEELAKKNIVTLSVWDLSGQKHYRTIRSQFYLGAHAGILIFDVTKKESFDNLKHWINEVEQTTIVEIPFILVGNKIDLPDHVITEEDMVKLKTNYKQIIMIHKTSALTGEGIKELFKSCAKIVYSNVKPSPTKMKPTTKPSLKKLTKTVVKPKIKPAKKKKQKKKLAAKASAKKLVKITSQTEQKPSKKKKSVKKTVVKKSAKKASTPTKKRAKTKPKKKTAKSKKNTKKKTKTK